MNTDVIIYVVDDDEAIRLSLAKLIASADLPVECFESCDEFLANFDRSAVGCLLLDVNMPGKSGLDLLETISKTAKRLAIIVMSGYGEDEIAAIALNRGAADFLQKPFQYEVLIDRITKAIHQKRMTGDKSAES
ncbi:MAG: response regulator [Planctomycetes bacterium]|nr:response regulator [Planctomycetota bacterium]